MMPHRPVTEIRLQAGDAAVVNLPAGTTIRVIYPDGTTREDRTLMTGDPECDSLPVIARIWDRVFGGAWICTDLGLRGIRNGHHRRDRAVWHEAARVIRDGGVAYVEHEQRDWYGKPVWIAVRVREER